MDIGCTICHRPEIKQGVKDSVLKLYLANAASNLTILTVRYAADG